MMRQQCNEATSSKPLKTHFHRTAKLHSTPARFLRAPTIAAVVLLSGCVHLAPGDSEIRPGQSSSSYPTRPSKIEVKAFGEGTIRELSKNGEAPLLVFAIYKNAKSAAGDYNYPVLFNHPSLGKPSDLKAVPFHAGDIIAWDQLSIIKTSNPKICIQNTWGGITCFDIP